MARRKARTTPGGPPTVFSLKSRRSSPARPSRGGWYFCNFSTASRARIILEPRVHGIGVGYQPFSFRQGHDRVAQAGKPTAAQALHGNGLHKIRCTQAAAQARCTSGRQNVIAPRGIIARRNRAVTAEKYRTRGVDAAKIRCGVFEQRQVLRSQAVGPVQRFLQIARNQYNSLPGKGSLSYGEAQAFENLLRGSLHRERHLQ